MRNLTEYPITDDEIIEELKQIALEHYESLKGGILVPDMRGLLIGEAISKIRRGGDKHYDV